MPHFLYHPKTHEYLKEMSRNPKKLPNATKTRPPSEGMRDSWGFRHEMIAVYDPAGDRWELMGDFRREWEDDKGVRHSTGFGGYWLPLEGDAPGCPPRFNEAPGPLPAGAVTRFPAFSEMREKARDKALSAYWSGLCAKLGLSGIKDWTVFSIGDLPVRLDIVSRAASGKWPSAESAFAIEFPDRDPTALLAELDGLRLEMAKRIREIDSVADCDYTAMYKIWLEDCGGEER